MRCFGHVFGLAGCHYFITGLHPLDTTHIIFKSDGGTRPGYTLHRSPGLTNVVLQDEDYDYEVWLNTFVHIVYLGP